MTKQNELPIGPPFVDLPGEVWRPIFGRGYDGYEVSDHGRVRSYRYGKSGRRRIVPVLRKLVPSVRYGYLTVMFFIEKKYVLRNVHQLVLEAFVGPRPTGTETRHVNDRDVTNNLLSNLEWGTHRQNEADKVGFAYRFRPRGLSGGSGRNW